MDTPLAAVFTDKGHKISIRTINLNQLWQGIHRDLLALVALREMHRIPLTIQNVSEFDPAKLLTAAVVDQARKHRKRIAGRGKIDPAGQIGSADFYTINMAQRFADVLSLDSQNCD